MKKRISLLLCMLLSAAVLFAGCKKQDEPEATTVETTEAAEADVVPAEEDSIFVEEVIAGDDIDLDIFLDEAENAETSSDSN